MALRGVGEIIKALCTAVKFLCSKPAPPSRAFTGLNIRFDLDWWIRQMYLPFTLILQTFSGLVPKAISLHHSINYRHFNILTYNAGPAVLRCIWKCQWPVLFLRASEGGEECWLSRGKRMKVSNSTIFIIPYPKWAFNPFSAGGAQYV